MAGSPDYVDPATCAGCHAEIAADYAETGMAQAFYRPRADRMVEDFAANNVFYHEPSQRRYAMIERDGRYFQRRSQLDGQGRETNVVEKEVHYVMGSGNHARTYLHQYPNGKLVQLPLGWYSERGGFWAMNPGYDQPRHAGFRREIGFECMFCHNAYNPIEPGSDAPGRDPLFPGTLAEGIDCQRCHGPGRRHVEAVANGAGEGEIRQAIFNSAHESRERQLEVCMQCHLETTSRRLPFSIVRFDRAAFSYRPNEPLASYTLHFDHEPGPEREKKYEIAHAAYRLRKSECFAKSEMTCTTCHDPHRARRGEEATLHYAEVCRSCHENTLSSGIASGGHRDDADCMSCHMVKRRTDDVVQVVMTDHYIQRRLPDGDPLAPIAETHETAETRYRGAVDLYYPPELDGSSESDLYLAAAQVIEESNFEEGVPRLQALVDAAPDADGAFAFQLAEAYWKLDRREEALDQYERAASRSPNHLIALRNYGVSLSHSGRHSDAETVLRRAISLEPEDSKNLTNLGETLIALGRPQEAVEALDQALRIDPDSPEAFTNLAEARSRLGEADEALEAARNAVRISPDFVLGLNKLANLLLARERLDEAERHLLAAIRYDPEFATVRYNYATLLMVRERFDEAERQLREAIRLEPGMALAHSNLGNLLGRKGDVVAAEGAFRRAAAADPGLAEAHFNLGTALAAQQRFSEARSSFEAALKADPDYDQARLNLGIVLASEGETQAARIHLDIAARSELPEVRQAAQGFLNELGGR